MPRRRRRRQPDAFDFIETLVGPIAALVLLSVLFAPVLLHVFLGLVALFITIAACIAVAVLIAVIVWRILRKRKASSGSEATSATPRRETNEAAWISEAIRKYPRLESEIDPPKLTQPQNLQEKLRTIDWFQFEKVVSSIYEVRGCKVKRLGGAKPDGGIDLIVEMGSERLVVQCKHWKKWSVGVRHIREFLGALKDANIEKGVLVTLRGCTAEATTLAKKHGIDIVEEVQLVELMRNRDGSLNKRIGAILNDDKKLCPRCDRPLVMRTAKKGRNPGERFWGCTNYPRCHYILRNA